MTFAMLLSYDSSRDIDLTRPKEEVKIRADHRRIFKRKRKIEIAMNEDLSSLLEQALQYASPLPVSEATVSIETDTPEPEACPRMSSTGEENDDPGLNLSCNISAQNCTQSDISDLTVSQNSGTTTVLMDTSEFAIFSDGSYENQNVSFNTLECVEEIIESRSKVVNDMKDTEVINMDVLSKDSNLSQSRAFATLTDIEADSTSSLISDIHDITDACLRFENGGDALYTTSVENTVNTEGDDVKPKIKRRRRREKNPDPPPEPVLPPCSICEDKSSGYHYGANTCEACKGFYRRTLKKKEVDYKCRCTPEEKEAWKRGPFKNGCPACRYERCLAVGMSKNAIKIGRYTLNHKTKNIKIVKTVETIDNFITALTQTTDSSPQSTSSLGDLSNHSSTVDLSELSINTPPTSDDNPPVKRLKTSTTRLQENSTISLKEIDSIVKILTEAHTSLQIDDRARIPTETIRKKQDEYLEKYKLQRELFGSMGQLSKDEFTEFYYATGIDIDGRLASMDTAFKYFEEKITMVVAFAKTIPGFKKLSLDDQANLIKASRVESTLICTYKNMLRNFDKEKKIVTTPWGSNLHLDELGRIVPRDLLLLQHDTSRQLLELNLSTQEEAILRALVIVFSDRCKLDDPLKVDAIQEKLVSCLQHLVQLRPGGAGTSLYKIFSVITNLRNNSDKSMNFQKTLLVNWPMFSVSNYHLLREFLT